MTYKILEDAVRNRTGAPIRFDHEHLIRLPGVDIAVGNFSNARVRPEGANGTASTPVAIYIFDEEVIAAILVYVSEVQ